MPEALLNPDDLRYFSKSAFALKKKAGLPDGLPMSSHHIHSRGFWQSACVLWNREHKKSLRNKVQNNPIRPWNGYLCR